MTAPLRAFVASHKKTGRVSARSGVSARDFLYRRIADGIRRKVTDGAYPPGSRLPSLNELAEAFGVNRLTAHKAVETLRAEGLVYSVRAQGTFVTRREEPRNMSEGRALVVGLLAQVLYPSNFGPYHQEMIAGMCDALRGLRANLMMLAAGASTAAEIPDLKRNARADALVYLGAFDPDLLCDMVREGPAAVVLDFQVPDLPCDSVSVNNEAVGEIAMRHLLECGCGDSFAVIQGALSDPSTTQREEGVRRVLAAEGLPQTGFPKVSGRYTREGGREAMRALLATAPAPKGVFCMNDEMASGALEVLREAGLRVPEDVQLIGVDDTVWAQATTPPLTTVRIDARMMGAEAVRLLAARLKSPGAPFTRTVVTPVLVRRGSTR